MAEKEIVLWDEYEVAFAPTEIRDADGNACDFLIDHANRAIWIDPAVPPDLRRWVRRAARRQAQAERESALPQVH